LAEAEAAVVAGAREVHDKAAAYYTEVAYKILQPPQKSRMQIWLEEIDKGKWDIGMTDKEEGKQGEGNGGYHPNWSTKHVEASELVPGDAGECPKWWIQNGLKSMHA